MFDAVIDFAKWVVELFLTAHEQGLLEGLSQNLILIILVLAVLVIAVIGIAKWRFPNTYNKLILGYSLKNGELTIYKPLFSRRMKAYQYDVYKRVVDEKIRYEIRISSAPWFNDRANITTLIIKDGVTHISPAAFAECSNLKDVYLPKSLVSIGDYAFNDCVSLPSVSLPERISYIGEYAFNQCEKLNEVNFIYIHSSYRNGGRIGNGAFRDCKNLKSIGIPDGVTSIDVDAFINCNALESVYIPYGVTSIGDWAFCNCNTLTSVNIPNSVRSIGYRAFYNCSALTSVYIPDSVISIGSVAFWGCSALTSVEVPADAEVDPDAFDSNITTVTRREQ